MSHKPRSENCEHDMQMIGDLVFECGRCGHTEFGCSHSKTSTIEVRQGRSITEKTVCDICHLVLD